MFVKTICIMPRVLVFCACLVYSLTTFAQTKLISHRSHSGSTANFILALEGELFDMPFSNFGMAPQRTVRTAELDSVIFISDSVAVMVTSNYCFSGYVGGFPDASTKSLWRAGRDTARNHVLFKRQHELDSIKLILKRQYFFRNSVDSVKFIGYDNQGANPKRQQKQWVPAYSDNPGEPGEPGNGLWVAVLVLALISMIIALLPPKSIKAN